jgi:hypothetical protein
MTMSRTYLSGNNSRGHEVTGMNATYSHLRGWNAGVKAEFINGEHGEDTFAVFMTSGSRGGRLIRLGTVRETPDGPVWESSDINEELG